MAILWVMSLLVGLHAVRLSEVGEEVTEVVMHTTDRNNASSRAMVPYDFWDQGVPAANRCRAARRGRNVRRFFGLIAGAVFFIPFAGLSYLGSLSLYWMWWLKISSVSAVKTALFVSHLSSIPAGIWASAFGARLGDMFTTWTTDLVARLFGQDGHKPACCCVEINGEEQCAIAQNEGGGRGGTTLGRKTECPIGSEHNPTGCEMPELNLKFRKTHSGCECKDIHDCGANKYYRGHPWCIVSSSKGCKPFKFKRNIFRHWDYCRIVPRNVEGTATKVNEYVAKFSINRDKSWFRADPRFVWRFGSWVDTSKALVIAPGTKVGNSKTNACFAGYLEETLDGCAQQCVEQGAIVVDEKSGTNSTIVPCHAFAYNRLHRFCVRLPQDATGAEFRPWQVNPALLGANTADGWQNFKRVDFD